MAAPSPVLTLRRLEAGEGSRLVRCIERCYGATHVEPALYDAEAIDAQLAAGLRHAAVAVTEDGEVGAHLGIALRRAGDRTADTGLTMVDPRFRGRGLAHRLALEVGRIALELGLHGLHDYPVTVHGGTQRLGGDHAIGVGFLIDNMPADVDFREMGDATGRATPSLVRYIRVGSAPTRAVSVPPAYRELARDVYDRAQLSRTFSDAPRPADTGDGGAELERFEDPRRGVVKLQVSRLGRDPAELVAAIADARSARGPTQLDLPLDDPRTPGLVDRLRGNGFFFGGLLPEFHRGDVLRLQRLPRPLRADEVPTLESEPLQRVAEFVVRDAEHAR